MSRALHNILALAVVAFAVVACGKSENFGLSGDSAEEDSYTPGTGTGTGTEDTSDTPISFASTIWDEETEETRNSPIENFEEGNSIGVYAFLLPEGNDYDPDELIPNLMYNQLVTMTGTDTWTYSPIKYWPANPNDSLKFFGYSPYSENEASTMFKESLGGFPIIVHTTPNRMVDTEDLVMAGRSCTKEIGTVLLEFEHVLSRVRFAFRNDLNSNAKTYSMVLKSLKLINATTQSAFTYIDDDDSTTGLLLVEYVDDNVQGVGEIVCDIESGALIGNKGVGEDGNITLDDNGYTSDAYIEYNNEASKEYTNITTDGVYLYIDPFVTGTSVVQLELTVGIYAYDDNRGDASTYSWELVQENTSYIDVSSYISAMERGESYLWQISYQPIEGSALMVYVLNYWDDVYNKHDM